MKPKYSQINKNHTLLAAGLLTASFVITPSVQAANWAGNVGNWSSTGNPGWNGAVPNAVGAVANFNAANMTPTQDISGGVTVGTLSFTTQSSSLNVRLAATSGITLNQDGSGSGRARIINTNPSVSAAFMGIESGTLTLADDLLISNTGNSTNTLANGGAIRIAAAITGTGNITIENALNNTSTGAGTIRLAGNNTFTGSVNVRSGLTAYTTSTAFGNAANVITLGAEGVGSASLMASATATVANSWEVAAGSTGTLTLGSIGTNALTFNGNGTLNGNITFLTGATDATRMKMNGVISGTGNITISSPGSGFVELINANTYSGSTTVSSGILRLTNALAMQNSALDTTNSVTGTGTAGFQYRPPSGTTLTLGGLTGDKNLASVFATGVGSFAGGYTTITALTLNPGTGVTRTYSAAIANGANNMTLTKTGLGTQVLSGTNTYTGATNVNAGTLVVEGSISTSSLTTVANGGTLGGTGTVGKTVISAGGTLAVGASPGTMTFTDTLGLSGTTVMEIDGTAGAGVNPNGHDFINLTGAGAAGVLTYGGTMTLDIGTTFGSGSYSWNLFDFASETGGFTGITLADQYSGTLTDAGSGVWGLTSGFNTWQFSESTGVLGLTVVPEPRAALLGSLGMLMLLRRRR
jgi:autotransporter-associated beta strand protein